MGFLGPLPDQGHHWENFMWEFKPVILPIFDKLFDEIVDIIQRLSFFFGMWRFFYAFSPYHAHNCFALKTADRNTNWTL